MRTPLWLWDEPPSGLWFWADDYAPFLLAWIVRHPQLDLTSYEGSYCYRRWLGHVGN